MNPNNPPLLTSSPARNLARAIAQAIHRGAGRMNAIYPESRAGTVITNYGNGLFLVDIPGEYILDRVPTTSPRTASALLGETSLGARDGSDVTVVFDRRSWGAPMILDLSEASQGKNPPSASGGGWPQYNANNGRTCGTSDLIQVASVIDASWFAGLGVGIPMVAVATDEVLIARGPADDDFLMGTLRAWDLTSGSGSVEVWRIGLPSFSPTAGVLDAAIHDGWWYGWSNFGDFHGPAPDGPVLNQISVNDGSRGWTVSADALAHTRCMCFDDSRGERGRMYAVTGNYGSAAKVTAIDLELGATVWTTDVTLTIPGAVVAGAGDAFSNSLIYDENSDVLYLRVVKSFYVSGPPVNMDHVYVVRINPVNGAIMWMTDITGSDGARVVVGMNYNQWGLMGGHVVSPIFTRFTAGDNLPEVVAVNADGAISWRTVIPFTAGRSPTFMGPMAIAGSAEFGGTEQWTAVQFYNSPFRTAYLAAVMYDGFLQWSQITPLDDEPPGGFKLYDIMRAGGPNIVGITADPESAGHTRLDILSTVFQIEIRTSVAGLTPLLGTSTYNEPMLFDHRIYIPTIIGGFVVFRRVI